LPDGLDDLSLFTDYSTDIFRINFDKILGQVLVFGGFFRDDDTFGVVNDVADDVLNE